MKRSVSVELEQFEKFVKKIPIFFQAELNSIVVAAFRQFGEISEEENFNAERPVESKNLVTINWYDKI